jgi:replicative superfamily II helicase
LPAQTVIIRGSSVYDTDLDHYVDLKAADVLQMFGRAGRPQFDSIGNAILITTEDYVDIYKQRINAEMVAESNMMHCLEDHLNAEIVLGNVTNFDTAFTWFKRTFLWFRVQSNSSLYFGQDLRDE